MVLKMLGCALFAICSSPIIVVGVGALKPLDMMREPVTMMSRSGVSAGGVDWSGAGATVSCAAGAVCADAGAKASAAASAARLVALPRISVKVRRSNETFPIIHPLFVVMGVCIQPKHFA